MTKVLLAANTWTDISSYTDALSDHVIVTTDLTDVKLGRKATAPSNGVALTAGEACEQIIKFGDVLVLWAFSTAGGFIRLESTGPSIVVLDGTGTT